MTGERIKGKELVKCGLATHFVSSNKIDSLKNALIEISDDNVDYQKLHQICNNYADLVYDAKEFYFPNMGEINKIFLHDNLIDCIKRIKTLSIEGNEENKKWANNILKILSSYSPISLLLHFEQIKKGIKITTLNEAYDLELKLIYKYKINLIRILEGNELVEGIRALLVEKDNKPNWKYKSVEEINEIELFKEYF